MNVNEQRKHWNGNYQWINMELFAGCYDLFGSQDERSIDHYLIAAQECGAWG